MKAIVCGLLLMMIGCAGQQVQVTEQVYTRPPVVEKVAPPEPSIDLPALIDTLVTKVPPEPVVEKTTPTVEGPVPADEWNDEAKLWLTRSILGEVGWLRPAEQTAVAWVYANRARESKRYDFIGMVKQYSAAVRSPGQRRNPWLFEMGFNMKRPPSWPNGPRWEGLHDRAWMAALKLVDEWQAGKIPNYCKGANHFGGYVDQHRAEAKRWVRIKCKAPQGSKRFRNRFYTSKRLRPKRSRRYF